MKDWVKEWYNDQFDKIDLTPSSDVWDNISRTMEDWPKHWYASNVNDLGTKPRKDTWEQLNSHLSDQRRVKQSNRFSYAVAATISVLLLTIPLNTEDSLFSDYFQSAKFAGLNSSSIDEQSSSTPVQKEFQEPKGSISITPRDSELNLKKSQKIANDKSIGSPGAINEEYAFKPLPNDILITKKDQQYIDVSAVRSLPILISKTKGTDFGSHLRVSDDSNNTNWMSLSVMPQLSSLNNPISQTAMASDKESLSIRPSMTYAISAGHKFDVRNGIKLSLLLNNQKRLRSESSTDQRSIDMNYVSLAALYTSTWSFGDHSRFAFNSEIGMIAGYNTNNNIFFNQERITYLEDGFGKFDLGTMIGASISAQLSDDWSISAGVNSQIGITNVFRGNELIPSDFFRTTTQSVGFSLGLIRTF